jgi:hypothetical protein
MACGGRKAEGHRGAVDERLEHERAVHDEGQLPVAGVGEERRAEHDHQQREHDEHDHVVLEEAAHRGHRGVPEPLRQHDAHEDQEGHDRRRDSRAKRAPRVGLRPRPLRREIALARLLRPLLEHGDARLERCVRCRQARQERSRRTRALERDLARDQRPDVRLLGCGERGALCEDALGGGERGAGLRERRDRLG